MGPARQAIDASTAAAADLSAAQARVVDAALDLFAKHGVGGTSLQMIARALGVTKAAVYHQFRTKDEIVLAAAEGELTRLQEVLDRAEAETTRAQARHVLVSGIVDLAVDRRRTSSVILNDPVIRQFFADHDRFRRVMGRMTSLLGGGSGLTGGTRASDGRVATAVFVAAVSGAVMHPLVAGLDDDTMRAQLRLMAHKLLDVEG
jgi:AcrR family transcriptional regulator